MLDKLKSMLGFGEKTDYGKLIQEGAIIVDVRSRNEFAGGHLKNSINIPLDQLAENVKKLKAKDQPILTCCASGMRSGSAKSTLTRMGYTNVHNAGPWQNLKRYDK